MSPVLAFKTPESAVPALSPAAVSPVLTAQASSAAQGSFAAQGWNTLKGRLCEVSSVGASAGLSTVMDWVKQAQLDGEPAAWIQVNADPFSPTFFPPDVAQAGIDLRALPTVFVSQAVASARAAEQLLRSGAFALVVIDAGVWRQTPDWSVACQSRLLGLCQKHDAACVFVTSKPEQAPSVGSLISLRVHAERFKLARANAKARDAKFSVRVGVLKDKKFGPGAERSEVCDGPPGLR